MCPDTDVSGIPNFNNFEEYLDAQPALAKSTRKRYNNIVRDFQKRRYTATIEDASRYISKHPTKMTKAGLVFYSKYLKDKVLLSDIRDLKIKTKEPKPRTPTTYDEFMKVIGHLKKEDKLIALFTLFTGARIQEPFTVKRKDFDSEGKVTIRSPKTGKWRVVYLPEDFTQTFLYWLNDVVGRLDEEYLFYTNLCNNSESKAKWFYHKLQRVSNRVLGKNIPTHDFRRFCATFLYEKTKDLQFVKRIMGHADINTTFKYTQYADKTQDFKKAKLILSELQHQQRTPGTARA